MSEPPCSLEILQAISLKVVEASPDAKIVINELGHIIIFNQQAEFLFGYDRSEVEGKPIEMLLPERLREVHKSHREHYFQQMKTREMGEGMNLLGLMSNGTEFGIQIKLAPIMVPKAGRHALAVVRGLETKNDA